MTRQRKTPRQRAEQQLLAADRAVKRLSDKRTALKTGLDAVTVEYDAAVARQRHLAQHPDLKPNPPSMPGGKNP